MKKIKKYRVGQWLAGVIPLPWLIFYILIGAFITWMFIGVGIRGVIEDSTRTEYWIALFIFFILGPLSLIYEVLNLIYCIRKIYAKKGKIVEAVIIKIKTHEYLTLLPGTIEYLYENEYGVKCIGVIKTVVPEFYEEKDVIEVYLRGKYAYFDTKRRKSVRIEYSNNGKPKKKKNPQKKIKAQCEYCNSAFDIKLDKCPYCGALHIIKEENIEEE